VTLAEALNTVRNAPSEAGSFDVMLACSFTPLHLRTFLCAHLQQRLPERSVRVGAGLYGDIFGTLDRISGESVHALAIALEWSDLDPRLGYRATGSWGEASIRDILSVAAAALRRLAEASFHLFSELRDGRPQKVNSFWSMRSRDSLWDWLGGEGSRWPIDASWRRNPPRLATI